MESCRWSDWSTSSKPHVHGQDFPPKAENSGLLSYTFGQRTHANGKGLASNFRCCNGTHFSRIALATSQLVCMLATAGIINDMLPPSILPLCVPSYHHLSFDAYRIVSVTIALLLHPLTNEMSSCPQPLGLTPSIPAVIAARVEWKENHAT